MTTILGTDGSTLGIDLESDGIGSEDEWMNEVGTAVAPLIPSTMRFEYVKVPYATVTSPGVDVPTVEGHAVGVASNTTYHHFLPLTVWPTPRTVAFAMAFRAKFPLIQAATTTILGASTGNTLIVGMGRDHTTNATRWALFPSGGSIVVSEYNADDDWHTFALVVNPTNSLITAIVDGVTVATSAQVSTLINTACDPAAFTSLALTPGVVTSRLTYGYVDAS